MDLSGAQLALEDYLDTSSNGNSYYAPGMQYVGFLDDFDTTALGADNVFKPCSASELFGPQMTVMPPQPDNGIFDSHVPALANLQDGSSNVVGAGPLPIDFEMPSTQERNCNGITDFTKRRNWQQRVVEEIKDFLHILTPDGRIIFASSSAEQLTGYSNEELKGRFIIDFIHPDDSGLFLRELNESIATGNLFKLFYRFRRKDQTHTIFESHGHPHLGPLNGKSTTTNNQRTCCGYFMVARPYLTKNAMLLDSILEHKIENIRLLKRIEDLRKEEVEEEGEYQRKWSSQPAKSETNSETTVGSSNIVQNQLIKALAPNDNDALSMPPPAKPINAPLTKKALEESSVSLKPYSINDKMARYEGFTPVESIEMLTGLRYQNGERSYGISTGSHSPILIKGDAGISIPLDKEVRSDKKRKIKNLDEYVCTDCGTLDSPEWRKGPSGPKTLCNACGLRWAKREKKNPLKCKNTPSSTKIPENKNIRW